MATVKAKQSMKVTKPRYGKTIVNQRIRGKAPKKYAATQTIKKTPKA